MSDKLSVESKILIVSNQKVTGPLWVFSLQQQNLTVVLEADPARAVQQCEFDAPELIVLDINSSEAQTLELIKNLRSEVIAPIMLLTSVRADEYVLEAYKAGVDDCLFKPVSPSLFQAKIKVWLRRSGTLRGEAVDPLKVGGLQLFPSEKVVLLKNGGAVRLTNLELRLLYCLMGRPGHTVTIEELNQRVWGYASETDNTMLKNVVYRLRRKIEVDPASPLIIQTITGVGYRLAAE